MSATRDEICNEANLLLTQLAEDQQKCTELARAYRQKYSPLKFSQNNEAQKKAPLEDQIKKEITSQIEGLQKEMKSRVNQIKECDKKLGLKYDQRSPGFMATRHV